jgi:hypothetical protein
LGGHLGSTIFFHEGKLNGAWRFNIVLNDGEKFGGVSNSQDGRLDLSNFISRQALMDLNLRGTKYNWSNRRVGEDLIQVKLDRAFIFHEWIQHYYYSLSSFNCV